MPAPSDLYLKDVDFTALALQYPEFSKKLKSNGQLDFSDPESIRQLTKSLLHRDFELNIELPEDRLCPPVPNRFNYILFVQKLLDSTQDDYSERYDPKRRVIGLDIGTGASAIYPLLACRQRPSWRFLATEIDETSRSFAEQNICLNELDTRIKIVATELLGTTIIPSEQLQRFDQIDILLTNPPFYSSESEMLTLAKQKSRPPNSACTGAPIEMICPGGEVAFVSSIIEESTLDLNKTKIQWFSSMLGKLGSVSAIIQKLKDIGCTNYAVTEFVQGQKTRRWCVAWSWMDFRPAHSVARGTDAVDKLYLPFPTELEITLNQPAQFAVEKITECVSQLDRMEWRWNPTLMAGVGRSVEGNIWSRHARRKQKKSAIDAKSMMDVETTGVKIADASNNEGDDEDAATFVFKVQLKPNVTTKGCTVTVRWLQGHDSTTFESFHGWLRRKLIG